MVEWLLPTAAFIFVTNVYFEGFLQEAGKDHYQALTRGLAALWRTFFGPKRSVRMHLLTSAPEKIANEPRYSLGFSLMAEAAPGRAFKVLIPDDASVKDLERTAAVFEDFLRGYYLGGVELLEPGNLELSTPAMTRGIILLTRDHESDVLCLVDPRTGHNTPLFEPRPRAGQKKAERKRRKRTKK